MQYGEIGWGWITRGGQLKRYKDMLHNTLKNDKINKTWEELYGDRSAWKTAICQCNGMFKAEDLRTLPSPAPTVDDSYGQGSGWSAIGGHTNSEHDGQGMLRDKARRRRLLLLT